MKRVFKIAAILAGIAIIGCNRIDLVAPALISPADGAALYSGLAFIWGAGEEAEEYVIHVWTGSTDVIEDTLTDTTYTMSDSAFSALVYGIYNWAVASKAGSKLAWSESWSFSLTQPGAPKLIAPQDSAVFDTEPPTFIWSSDSLEPDYVIRIFTDTTIVLQDTLSDTSYVMSVSVFDILENGTYDWWVGTVIHNELIVSETRTFNIIRPVDLDTTYFPAGLDYEWVYERHVKGHYYGTGGNEDEFWDYYDTIAIKVTDSSYFPGELIFNLSGGGFHGKYIHLYGSFRDVGWHTHIIGDCVELLLYDHYESIFIPLKPLSGTNDFLISYTKDTLCITLPGYNELPNGIPTVHSLRIKGIGVVKQDGVYDAAKIAECCLDRLLYFYNGRDTVYKAE